MIKIISFLFLLICYNSSASGVINGNIQVCEGTTNTYFIAPVLNSISYTWTLPNGCSGSSSINSMDIVFGSESGLINLDVSVVGGTILNYSVFVSVDVIPTALFTPSDTVCNAYDSDIFFLNQSLNAVNYSWDFGNGIISSLESLNSDMYIGSLGEFNITLIAFSNFGCSDTIFHTVTVKDDYRFYIPSSFTPDKDAYNEVFNPVLTTTDPFEIYELIIGNRAEGVLFESHDPNRGWDGRYNDEDCSGGVYPWIINYKTKNSDKVQTIYGHVNLLK